jgi:hypothetical protein
MRAVGATLPVTAAQAARADMSSTMTTATQTTPTTTKTMRTTTTTMMMMMMTTTLHFRHSTASETLLNQLSKLLRGFGR